VQHGKEIMKIINKDDILFHLKSLNEHDRYLRFLSLANDLTIENYVQSLSYSDLLFGVYENDILASCLHAHITEDNICEFGISTLEEYRGRGLGKKLLDDLFMVCYDKKIKKVICLCLRNNRWMMQIAKKYSMNLEFDGTTCWAEKTFENLC
jgi:GNAT superfamily N-acetyltransferase